MADIARVLAAFQKFALSQIVNRSSDVTIDELFDDWRRLNPIDQEFLDSTRAIAASLRDLEAGETGRAAEVVLEELKSRVSR